MQYTELHLHDYYSILDGLNSPQEYMARAAELGMTHLAQTNHGTLGGHRDFQKAANDAGIVPILGLEAYISPTDRFDKRSKASRSDGTSIHNHIILLAENQEGLKNLNRLNEIAWSEGFYHKPRIDMDLLEEYNQGLIVLSGCLGGLISRAIEAGDQELAYRTANRFKSMLGDRFYIEIQGHNPPELNAALLEISATMKIEPVITSDCHYARKEDLWVTEAMLILQSNPKINFDADFNKSQKMDLVDRFNYLYPDRFMSFQDIEIYLRDAAEQQALLQKQGITSTAAISNTNLIAQRIGAYVYHEGLDLLPRPKNAHPDDLLSKKAWAGLKKRGLDGNKIYSDRLAEELHIISDKDFSTYFLIVANMVKWAKEQDILVGPGRGSAVGSLTCYALDITQVDPIENNLLFFRFINPERNDFPDIDIDFEDRRRNEIKEYLRRQYKHVANIATVGYYRDKGVIRDAAKVYRVPLADVNKAMKAVTKFEEFEVSPNTKDFRIKYPEVLPLARELKDRIRQTGMHASGMVLSTKPISNFAPIETGVDPTNKKGPRLPLVAYDMNQVADIGLIKLDLLGLKALSTIHDTINSIADRCGKEIDLYGIDLEDQAVYGMLSEGYTKGVFQCEAMPYTALILKMGGMKSFAELAASNALVRPGAMNTIGTEYIMRKKGQREIKYAHPLMEPFTKDTYGEVLYQEQVMLTMTELAGMSMATADKVRKIIGKKLDKELFKPFMDEFITGASKNVTKAVAERLWEHFQAHAEYSFNKSHAVAYSLLSYWTAWLKFYYPLDFMYSTLKNEKDKDSRTEYLIETKRLGVKVLLPDVNKSELDFTISDGGIRFGLADIKSIAAKTGARLIEARPFTSYDQLQTAIMEKGSGMNTTMLRSLNAIGAAAFPDNPRRGDERENFYEYLGIPAFDSNNIPPKIKAQFTTLDEYDETGMHFVMGMCKKIKRGTGWSRVEMVDETGTAGIFHSEDTKIEVGNMYVLMVADNRIEDFVLAENVKPGTGLPLVRHLAVPEYPELTGDNFRVISFRKYITKTGKTMAYAVFSGREKNLFKVLIFPMMYHKAVLKCQAGNSVFAQFDQKNDGTIILKEVY